MHTHTYRVSTRIRDSAVQLPQFIHVVQDVYEAKGEDTDHVTCQRQQKQEEIAVVSPPDAVVHPRTVMVKVLRRDDVKRKITHSMSNTCEISTALSNYTLFNTGCLNPFSNCISTETTKDLRKGLT